MNFQTAERLRLLPPYLFAEIDRMKQEVRARGVDLISFGIGDPDLPTPEGIVREAQKEAANPANHPYPSYEGMAGFREAVARFYQRRFQVRLDPATEITSLIGSKEGIAHFPLAFLNPGDAVLVPDPAYPVYNTGTLFAGGKPVFIPLKESNGFLPDLEAIPADVLKAAKILWLNYPNNPTGAVAPPDFLRKAIEFCRRHQLILAYDNAYSEMTYDGYIAPSILEFDGARDVAIEFHSFSKTYNMTGWRVGWACGNASLVAGLGRIKTNIDSGVFQAIQHAGIVALDQGDGWIRDNLKIWTRRRDVLAEGLRSLGWDITPPKGTFYFWTRAPKGHSSTETVKKLLNEQGIVTTPGAGFGANGEGYVRFTFTLREERISEAIERMRKIKW